MTRIHSIDTLLRLLILGSSGSGCLGVGIIAEAFNFGQLRFGLPWGRDNIVKKNSKELRSMGGMIASSHPSYE